MRKYASAYSADCGINHSISKLMDLTASLYIVANILQGFAPLTSLCACTGETPDEFAQKQKHYCCKKAVKLEFTRHPLCTQTQQSAHGGFFQLPTVTESKKKCQQAQMWNKLTARHCQRSPGVRGSTASCPASKRALLTQTQRRQQTVRAASCLIVAAGDR